MSKRRKRQKALLKAKTKKISADLPAPVKKKILTDRTIALIGLIATLITLTYFLFDRYKSKQALLEDNFASGTLDPDRISPSTIIAKQIYRQLEEQPTFESEPPLSDGPKIVGILLDSGSLEHSDIPFRSGTWFAIANQNSEVHLEDLERGIEFTLPITNGFAPARPACGKSALRFGVRDKRLYVSCDFYDIKTEEFIGSIEYNHWKVYLPNALHFFNDSKRLEVRDKQNNIVFSMKYFHPNDGWPRLPVLLIGGYFINNNAIIVVPNYPSNPAHDCFCFPKTDSLWRDHATNIIDSLITVFPEKSRNF